MSNAANRAPPPSAATPAKRSRRAATRKDELSLGTPHWSRLSHDLPGVLRPPSPREADVVVVGAGISGALMAEAISRNGRNVLVVDRRGVVQGSTRASTAMIQHEIDIPLTRLARQIGQDAAERAWRRSVLAVGDLLQLVNDLGIACDMRAQPALYLAGNLMGSRALRSEAEARTQAGIAADLLDRTTLSARFGIERPAAILSQASASCNPVRLACGLLATAEARGGRIITPLEITDLADMPDGAVLATRDGQLILAREVIFCTGYEHLISMQSRSHRVTSTWALATEPQADLPDWLRTHLIWEAAEPYLYMRADPDGRIIAGGEDEDASDANSDPRKLARKTRTLLGKINELTGLKLTRAATAWAAPFSVTRDGLPIIDRVPGFGHVHAIMGFGGNGLTFAMLGAQMTAARIAGHADPDASIFAYR